MPPNDRGGLKAAFTNFNKNDADKEAERRLLGRVIGSQTVDASPDSYLVATSHTLPQPTSGGLTPRPLLQREAVRQLSFRCPISIAAELKRKAAFNQLEQQEIIVEGIKRVLSELPDPPSGWEL
jgi:hypothetical protein